MRLPRDLRGEKLASLLRRHGYQVSRQTGSHLRLTPKLKGGEHHVTIPAHKSLKVGTLGTILADGASYLQIDRSEFVRNLFGM